MKSPLLYSNEQKKTNQNVRSHCAFFLLLAFFTFIFTNSFLTTSAVEPEEKVGTAPVWGSLLFTYFRFAPLTMVRQHGDPYPIGDNPEVDMMNCLHGDQVPMSCAQICRQRVSKRSHVESRFCLRLSKSQVMTSSNLGECWEVAAMDCWNKDGGMKLFDGRQNFTVRKHFLGGADEDSNFRWMHLESKSMTLMFFGWGTVKSYEDICSEVVNVPELYRIANNIPSNHVILTAGHSEGSGWAVCFNEYLHKQKIPNQHYVIGSGSLVPSKEYFETLDPGMWRNNLFLLLGIQMPPHIMGGLMLPDLLTIRKRREGVTFPQFAYTCDFKVTECIGFGRDVFDMNSAWQRVQEENHKQGIASFTHELIRDVHNLRNYRDCFHRCARQFIALKGSGFNFQTNVPSMLIYSQVNNRETRSTRGGTFTSALLPYRVHHRSPLPQRAASSIIGPSAPIRPSRTFGQIS